MNQQQNIILEQRERTSREIVQSYIATTAMYDFNVYEKRVLYNLVKLAQSQIEGIRLADNLYRIEHGLEDFLKIELPVSDFLTDSEDKNHSRIKAALKSLHQKTFTYRDDEVWECMSIISNPRMKLHSSKVSFIVNTKVWDVLLDFSRGFSRYDLEVAFSLESAYSMRFYEMLAGQEDPITYSIDALRKQFCLEDKYAMTKDFIRRVVEPAMRELDHKSPISFTYTPLKEGRKITKIIFFPVRHEENVRPELILKKTVRKYGYAGQLSKDEYRFLREIGFTESGIKNNFKLILECQKHLDFIYELALIKGKCRNKKNPCGWCIRTLKGKLADHLEKTL
jgi:plasmid replication initiation protein